MVEPELSGVAAVCAWAPIEERRDTVPHWASTDRIDRRSPGETRRTDPGVANSFRIRRSLFADRRPELTEPAPARPLRALVEWNDS